MTRRPSQRNLPCPALPSYPPPAVHLTTAQLLANFPQESRSRSPAKTVDLPRCRPPTKPLCLAGTLRHAAETDRPHPWSHPL